MDITFSINYSLSYREYFKAMLFLGIRMKTIKRLFLFIFILGGVSALLNLISPHKHEYEWYRVILPILFLPLFPALFFLVFGLLGSLLIYQLKPQFFKNLTYHFTHWGMAKAGKGLNMTTPWRYFIKWRETKSFLLLYVTLNDAHIIPKRAFKNEGELENFRILIREHIGLFP
ncbi:MAG: YcxB family protein [Bacteroidota bacterium]|nr:YcxB family protein [Bacteroidota bacterium]